MYFRFLSVYTIITLMFFGFLFTQKVNAASPSSISVSISPENPEPFENVDISLSSFANNLDTVFISWSINGKTVLSGIGKKSFSLSAPSANNEINVLVKITLPDGDVELSLLVKPTSTVMLWEADDSYTPPFYKGKALPSPDSSIKIVAMPEIRNGNNLVDPKNMSYSWKIDYNNDQNASGFGKNFYTYRNDYLEEISEVSVNVLTVDQKYTASGNVSVRSSNPKILFYARNPKMGTLWNNALQNNYKIKEGEVIEASPYFMSPENIVSSPSLIWSWYVNNEQVALPIFTKNIIPIKPVSGASGTAKIGLTIENRYKIFQSTNNEIDIQF